MSRSEKIRVSVQIEGQVQGVGFRPFVYQLAARLQVQGWASNTASGLRLELQGTEEQLEKMLSALQTEHPSHSQIQSVRVLPMQVMGDTKFVIRDSLVTGKRSIFVQPDLATCSACVAEMFNPHDRRYRYPFISCSHCGPRFSIIESLPYDRIRTAMRHFTMCLACQTEYSDPNDRRYYAQTNACWECGPTLELWDASGVLISSQEQAVQQTVAELQSGAVVALKGVGGFQLLADAGNLNTVKRLRSSKNRPHKAFAVMFPDLASVQALCHVTELEQKLLTSPAAPIVLLQRKMATGLIAENVAPENSNLGVMLPYSPLHHLLLDALQKPVIATSGNRGEEPICINERSAVENLQGIADYYLMHDRLILRALDDSVACGFLNREMLLRRARGYAPLPVNYPGIKSGILAVGAQHKNTIALSQDNAIILSQHIGNLGTMETISTYHSTIKDYCQLYGVQPSQLVCDLHPDYYSSQYAASLTLPKIVVQHHYAHALACMAEHALSPPVLGVIWDGSGYAEDNTLRGSEFLQINEQGFKRLACLLQFSLPGGEKAITEPRRSALGLLYSLYGESLFEQTDLATIQAFSQPELQVFSKMLDKRINTPNCSSMGRLFDAVASLLGLCQISSYEGQAAILVEQISSAEQKVEPYPFTLIEAAEFDFIIDWRPMLEAIILDIRIQTCLGIIAQKFHVTLAGMIKCIAQKSRRERLVLSGGCFQNRNLAGLCIRQLNNTGIRSYWQQSIPANDGGLAVGQVLAALQNRE